MIDHVEALLAVGIVDAADVDEADEAAFGIVAQEGQHADDLGGLGLQRQLAIGIGRAGDRGTQFRGDVIAQVLQGFSHSSQRSMVPVRRIFFCNCRMP